MKFLMFLTLFPALAWSYHSTEKSACTPIDIRNESLGLNRNQGKVSWCYAFTASDMLGYTFRLHEKISAADVALNYNESAIGTIMDFFLNNGNPHQTGFNKVALINAMKDGYCPEEIFPSEKWTKVENGNESQVTLDEAMKDIADLHKVKESLTENNLPYFFRFKNIEAKEFLAALKTKKLKTVYHNLRLRACKDDRISFDARWKVKMVLKHPGIFQRLNEQLELGRMVGLDYDSRILENKDRRGVNINELHTSGIVGRRWNDERNTCEYLVRDSKGPVCSTRYDSSYECHGGNLWLSESQIYGNMTSIVYMLAP